MKDVQCYELFGGIALKNHALFVSRKCKWPPRECLIIIIIIIIMVIFKCYFSGELIALSLKICKKKQNNNNKDVNI